MDLVNHKTRALSLLASQYKGSTKLRAIVSAIADECDALESALQDLFSKRALSTAEGTQLDIWGIILDTERFGLSDSDYRVRLESRVAESYSEGTAEDLIGIFLRLSGSENVWMAEYYPTSLELQAWNPDPLISYAGILTALLGAKVAGVQLQASYAIEPAFAFLEDTRSGNFGFDDGTNTVGGILAVNI